MAGQVFSTSRGVDAIRHPLGTSSLRPLVPRKEEPRQDYVATAGKGPARFSTRKLTGAKK